MRLERHDLAGGRFAWKCPACGWQLENDHVALKAICPRCPHETRPKPKGFKLGDAVEQGLEFLGITPERYVQFKTTFGGAPTCNCAKRQRWLNDLSAIFDVRDKLDRLLEQYRSPQTQKADP